MIQDGMIIYYKENQQIHEGKIFDIEKYSDEYIFSIEGYGTCEGYYRVSSKQIGIQYFLNKQDIK